MTSILDRLCGPLCDAVLCTTGSAGHLERLERRNLLVVPLDRRRQWYRYHQLFRELLESELQRSDPGLVPTLHVRAAAWCEANGLPETAIEHAQAAGDADTVARLVLQLCFPVMASGRTDTVRRWMEWFEVNDLIERYPGIAVTGGLQFAIDGRPAETERWADAAEATSTTGVLSDGSTIEGMLAFLQANLCRNGPEGMRRDAQTALHGLSPASPFRSNMIQVEGLSHLLEGDADRADVFFARAVDEATRFNVRPIVALMLADRGCAAIERNDWAAAEVFAEQTLSILDGGEFDNYWTSALVYAWTARVAAQRGDPEQGRQLVARAARLRPLLTYALPVVSARALLEMARAYIALADPGGARAVLRQANDIFRQRPALGNLPSQADELRAKADTIHAEGVGISSLTTAELRLLPLLPTHLSFRRSDDGSTSLGTPSSPRRCRSTASSGPRPAVQRSSVCTSSACSSASEALVAEVGGHRHPIQGGWPAVSVKGARARGLGWRTDRRGRSQHHFIRSGRCARSHAGTHVETELDTIAETDPDCRGD